MEREGYSVLGITSFIFAILGFIFFLLVWIFVDSPSETLVGSMAIIQFLMNLVGGATGIASLFSNSQKRLFGILGTIISSSKIIKKDLK